MRSKTFVRLDTSKFPPAVEPVRFTGLRWALLRWLAPGYVADQEATATWVRNTFTFESLPFDKEQSSNVEAVTRQAGSIGDYTVHFKEPFSAAEAMEAVIDLHEKRSWPEDFSHENGNYCCSCVNCGLTFTGHKRRVRCRQCTPAGDSK